VIIKIKLLKASYFYDELLNKEYRIDPNLRSVSYQEQYSRIMSLCFGWSDYWKIYLENLGAYEVEEVIINAKELQQAWAKENHINYSSFNWIHEILLAQLELFKPDIFFAEDYKYITPSFRKEIKKRFPSIKKIICWDGIARMNKDYFDGADIMLAPAQFILDYYQSNKFTTYLFQFGYEESISRRINIRKPIYDFTFVGSLVLFMNGHFKRLETLYDLSLNTNLKYWLSGTPPSLFYYFLFQFGTLNRGHLIDIMRHFRDYPKFLQLYNSNSGNAFGLDMYQILSDSKITLNTHIDAAKDIACNIRLWEATGVGTCLITDWKSNLSDIFRIDEEIVVYKSTEECIEKVNYLLDHEDVRIKIAQAGQKRTLENHSLKSTIEMFSKFLLNNIH
jgi:spore maturation protein CgeB